MEITQLCAQAYAITWCQHATVNLCSAEEIFPVSETMQATIPTSNILTIQSCVVSNVFPTDSYAVMLASQASPSSTIVSWFSQRYVGLGKPIS